MHSCPDRAEHLEVAGELVQAQDEAAGLRRQVRRRKGTIARTFERVLAVLRELGYVSWEGSAREPGQQWALTEKGAVLARVYNEADLLVVEAVTRGWLDGLDPDELAAVVSLFVYEARGRDEPEVAPTGPLSRHERRISDLYTSIRRTERRHDIELTKEPDAGFMAQIYEWSSGRTLEDVLEDRATSPGDFVRSAKQVLDLLQQLKQIAGRGSLGDALAEAVARVQRGVVAYSAVT